MTKMEQLNQLFKEWQEAYNFDIFGKDGIVDEKEFGINVPKIAFLLKDANVEKPEEADVCKNLSDTSDGINSFGKMWKVLCLWTKIAENPDSCFLDCCNEDMEIYDSVRKYLKKIAVVNLSKEHGKGVNNQDELTAKLSRSVRRYYNYTNKELDVIDPEIVICCGTYHHIIDEYNVKDKVLPSGARYFSANGKIFVEMCHPGSYSC